MDEPLLDTGDIQGNTLAGFNKDQQLLVALRIRSVAAARAWLGRVVPHISSLREVGHFNAAFRAKRARIGGDPEGLIATWVNIALSFDGLVKVASPQEAAQVADPSFEAGMPAQAEFLGDTPAAPGEEISREWVVGAAGHVPDFLVIIASDREDEIRVLASQLLPTPAEEDAPVVVWQELGRTRADLPGHEHFGFKDGISQPAVRGRVSNEQGSFLSSRVLGPAAEGDVEFANPGAPLVWPGDFVFGYPSTNSYSGEALPPAASQPPWLKNASLLVFRRLRQDVVGFHRFLREAASQLAATPEFTGIDAQRLGTMLVGRWPSGAPIARTPAGDIPALGAASALANDFLFEVDTPAPDYLPGQEVFDPFPHARADRLGVVCPHAAHVRKVNPRDEDTDRGDRFDTLRRRVLRRGIPYGPALAVPFNGDLPRDDGVDRGLHFLCYQTSIVNQFEILQAGWANTVENPQPRGHDMIIGQTGGTKPLEIELMNAAGGTRIVTTPQSFVTTTGGGYFLSPSISALADFARRT